jgi:DNA polymerase I
MAKTFYIIDGHAHMFRAYFAPMRELSSPTGEPTKAVFVFIQMLLNLIAQRKPDYLAMVIDAGGKDVHRKEIFPEYKANRAKQPADFHPQEQRIIRMVQDAGVPLFGVPGFEADDLIATMARRLCEQDYQVILVSRDKDLRQLINPCTSMYDVQNDLFIDARTMERECGYAPAQAVDIQTLTGDPTDNVPGIPGVGEKTAAKLVRKYGSAEAVLEHLDELTPKLRENFEKHGSVLALSRQLVTLDPRVPFEFDPEACRFAGLNAGGLRPHLDELGFSSLLKRLGLEGSGPRAGEDGPRQKPAPNLFADSLFGPLAEEKPAETAATSADCEYELVDTEEKLAGFVQELRKHRRFAFDTETDALGAMCSNLIGMSFAWNAGCGHYVPVRGPAGESLVPAGRVIAALKPILEDPAYRKVGHNLKYDLMVMRQAGVELRGIEMDTMIAAFLLDASRMQYGIDSLARDLLGFRKIATEEIIGRGRSQVAMDRIPLAQVARYASEDADIALRLADLFQAKLADLPAMRRLHDELETPLIEVLAAMECNGVAIDEGILREQSRVLGERAEALRREIMDSAGCDFNPDSPRQLADVLFNRLGLGILKRNKTGPSTDVEVLEKLSLEHRCPRLILEYRGLVKLKNTYLDNLTQFVNPRTGRIHASFNQTGAATGRLSCSDPNLQNIPIRTDEGRRIRLAFVPLDRRRDLLVTADYSQIELRVLAHFTEEPALLRAFESDEDIHAAVAAEVFETPLDQVSKAQRAQAKIINFGIIYGVSAFGLARRIDGMTVPAARDLIAAYNRRFPSIARFMDQCVMEAQANGYVETIMGRRRRIPELRSPVLAQRNAGERMAINSVVQGSAADLIKVAMLKIHRRLQAENRPSRMLLQVHDELVFETPESALEDDVRLIRHEMTTAMQLKVPLKVEVGWGKNWQEGK